MREHEPKLAWYLYLGYLYGIKCCTLKLRGQNYQKALSFLHSSVTNFGKVPTQALKGVTRPDAPIYGLP